MVRRDFYVFLAILFIKSILLIADSQPGYFLGDSEAYLATATIKYVPADRSVLYGLLLRRVALRAHSLERVIVLQALLSAIAAWLLFLALKHIFGVRFRVAALFAILCSIEPLQLLSERYVLTEACATFLFAVHFVLALLHVQRGRLWSLVGAQVIGVLLVAFRISLLPLVLIDSVLVPLLSPRRMRVAIAYLGVSIVVSQGLLGIYKNWYGKQIHREAAVFYTDGAFLVTDFAPLIEPEDFPVPAKRDAIFSNLLYDRHDPSTRAKQHFWEGGLWPNIEKEIPDARQANDAARATAIHALMRQPFGTLRLGLSMFFQYFDTRQLRIWLVQDEGSAGDAEMKEQTKDWLWNLYGVSDTRQYRMSPTKRWHIVAEPWYWAILFALILSPLLFMVRPAADRRLLVLCTIASFLFFAGATLLVDRPTARFLTSAAWMVLLLLPLALPDGRRSTGIADSQL